MINICMTGGAADPSIVGMPLVFISILFVLYLSHGILHRVRHKFFPHNPCFGKLRSSSSEEPEKMLK